MIFLYKLYELYEWGLGDWGLGIGPIPNPQSPIPKISIHKYIK